MLRPYKFIVQAVVQSVDDEGIVVGEQSSNPVELFGCDGLREWADGFTSALAKAEETNDLRGSS